MVQIGSVYRHYKKRKDYLVLSLATHSETLEPMVVYIALYENDQSRVWVRPLEMWEELVEDESGKKVPRFAIVAPAVATEA